MAYGMRPTRKGLFGAPISTPPIAPENGPGGPEMAPGLGMRDAPQDKGPSKWGQFGLSMLGNIGDAISRYYGGAPVYQQMQLMGRDEQERQARAQQAQLEHARRLAEFDYKQKNEIPTIQRNADYIRQTRGEQAANEYLDNYGQRPEEPRMVNIPGVGSYFGTMSEIQQILQGGGQAPSQQGSVPRVTDEAGYNALPAGAKFYDDEGNLRTKAGGPSQPATGGF